MSIDLQGLNLLFSGGSGLLNAIVIAAAIVWLAAVVAYLWPLFRSYQRAEWIRGHLFGLAWRLAILPVFVVILSGAFATSGPRVTLDPDVPQASGNPYGATDAPVVTPEQRVMTDAERAEYQRSLRQESLQRDSE